MSYQEYWFNFETPFNGIFLMLLYKLIFKLRFKPTTWDQEWLQICHDPISQKEAEDGWGGIAKLEQLHLQVLHSLIIKLQFSKW